MTTRDRLCAAIKSRSNVSFTYHGRALTGSPHAVGKGDGEERVLIYVGSDDHKKVEPPGGQWKCLPIADLSDVATDSSPFHAGHPGKHEKTGLHEIDVSL
ncbi:hypothetical protein GOB93_13780 [Acetobacter musti]|uniref:Uncharacterized protein n=1 Tax=Acetobacter musti TaxID=864732 RepID=A0ABX0JW34_9PROT|nr:hypothetical protein [Acetobacter musti]NHN85704.1 hypothetical protein [Acetobacter musti]